MRRWDAFWFPSVPVRRVALFRIAVAGFCAIELAFFARFLPRYGGVDEQFAQPMLLTKPFLELGLSEGAVLLVYLAALVALVLAAVGWKTRPALVVGAAGYTFLYALFNSFHKLNHGKITLILALWALVFAPAGAAYALDARRRRQRAGTEPEEEETSPLAGWALRFSGMVLIIAYVVSGIAKLRISGLAYATLPVIEVALIDRPDTAVRTFLLDHPLTLQASQVGLVIMELLAPLLLLGGRVRTAMVVVLATFHVSALLLLNVEFWGYILCLLAFFRLEEGVDRTKAFLRHLLAAPDRTAAGAR